MPFGGCKFPQQEKGTNALHEGYGTEVSDVKVVDILLSIVVPCDDVFCPAGEYQNPDSQKNSHNCPEQAHKDKSTLVVQDSYQDEITVEGHAGFLDLLIKGRQQGGAFLKELICECLPAMLHPQLLQRPPFP